LDQKFERAQYRLIPRHALLQVWHTNFSDYSMSSPANHTLVGI